MNAISKPKGPLRLVTITYFVTEMLGLNARQWYYSHMREAGVPQRIYIAGKPMLSYDECEAYVSKAFRDRPTPTSPPKPEKAPSVPKVKRHRGRPAKVLART